MANLKKQIGHLLPPAYGEKSKGVPTLTTWRSAQLDIGCRVCKDTATGYFRVNGQSAPCCGSQGCKDKLIEAQTGKK